MCISPACRPDLSPPGTCSRARNEKAQQDECLQEEPLIKFHFRATPAHQRHTRVLYLNETQILLELARNGQRRQIHSAQSQVSQTDAPNWIGNVTCYVLVDIDFVLCQYQTHFILKLCLKETGSIKKKTNSRVANLMYRTRHVSK